MVGTLSLIKGMHSPFRKVCKKNVQNLPKKNLSVPYLKKNSWARVSWTHIHALVKIPASPQFRSCKSPKASMIAIEHPLGNSSHKAFGRRAVPNKMPKQTNIWASLFAFLEQTPLQLSETSQRHNAIVNHLKKIEIRKIWKRKQTKTYNTNLVAHRRQKIVCCHSSGDRGVAELSPLELIKAGWPRSGKTFNLPIELLTKRGRNSLVAFLS